MSRHHKDWRNPGTWERRGIKRSVLHIHGLTCWLCKRSIKSAKEATMDHVKPAKYGGRYEVDNLRPAHRECNEWRGHGPPPPFRNDDPPAPNEGGAPDE